MTTEKSDKCEICHKNLIYGSNEADYRELACNICQKEFKTNIYCPDGHYICDACHSKEPIQVIEDFCETTVLKDPYEIADLIMKHPKFKVYGPEHHALVPAVVLTALKNNGIKKPNREEVTLFDIKEGIKRGFEIPGGWCGYYGCCGSGIGAGIALSLFGGATPSKSEPRTIANKTTSRALEKIADNLEHCCKRSVKFSILEALNSLKDNYGIILDVKPGNCAFSDVNDKCERENCPFY